MQKSNSLDQTVAVGGKKILRKKNVFEIHFVYSSIDNVLKVNSHTSKQPLLHTYRFMEGFKSRSPINLQYFIEPDSFCMQSNVA